MSKSSLRKKFKDTRSSVKSTSVLSDEIFSLIISSDLYKTADTILAYWSVGSEVSTHKAIAKALADKKRVGLPKCADNNGKMKFYYITSLSDISEGMYGIKEPSENCPADDFDERTLCLVPGLSFDKSGYRLGYGKGYYDRFLSEFCGISVGLCFDDCLTESLPKDKFDEKVNYIITNTKIYDLR